MEPKKLLEILHMAENLKDTTRHCYTSGGRHESVAEHCWRVCLMTYFLRDVFPDADMDKVIRMCLVHDLGEAFTGDIPAFEKTAVHEQEESSRLNAWVQSLSDFYCKELTELYLEMAERKSLESKIYKAADGLEALVQHNESDISTWLPLEYDLNMTYANDKVEFSPYLCELRQEIRNETLRKMEEAEKEDQ